MRKLDEQWIQDRRMYKAVGFPQYGCILCNGCDMAHGNDQREEKKAWCKIGDDFLPSCDFGNNFVVKDLGPVNEDGCLAEERTGEFPEISPIISYHLGKEEIIGYEVYLASEKEGAIFDICVKAGTKQEAKDAWNQREAL